MRTLSWDWYPGGIPDNVELDETAYVETSYIFELCKSSQPVGVRFGKASQACQGTMFDVGPQGSVDIGDYAMLNGVRIICDNRIEIGEYALISWNVVLMDTYRAVRETAGRRRALESLANSPVRLLPSAEGVPIRIGPKVWIGFNSCILPGVTIGEGSIVGARSVVTEDVPPYAIAAGNPARIVRTLSENV
jgi:acetyltransferase-like isoleucine patch superfamily enzyme